jgi:hypothetical protein
MKFNGILVFTAMIGGAALFYNIFSYAILGYRLDQYSKTHYCPQFYDRETRQPSLVEPSW